MIFSSADRQTDTDDVAAAQNGMTNIISLEEDRKWCGVSSLYSNKHKTIINTTATTLDVTKGSPWGFSLLLQSSNNTKISLACS